MRMAQYLKDKNTEHEYVNISVGNNLDEKRFIDIYTIINIVLDEFIDYKTRIINKITTFSEEILKAIKEDAVTKHKNLSKNLHEAKYTMLGYSKGSLGQAFGEKTYENLVNSIKNNRAFKINDINNFLDVQLYAEGIGVDLISDLISNLAQDVLSEYTEKTLNSLSMGDKIRYVNTYFWDEEYRMWNYKELAMVNYCKEFGQKEYNYLLVPKCFTSDNTQKYKIIKNIFDNCIYDIYKKRILSDKNKYKKYMGKNKKVYKYKVVECINDEFGYETKGKRSVILFKSLLDLIIKYPQIKKYIDENITIKLKK